jgi:hypothetical protein
MIKQAEYIRIIETGELIKYSYEEIARLFDLGYHYRIIFSDGSYTETR